MVNLLLERGGMAPSNEKRNRYSESKKRLNSSMELPKTLCQPVSGAETRRKLFPLGAVTNSALVPSAFQPSAPA